MGTMLQNPVRVTGMEEEPLNKSHGQRGNIAGNTLYYCFYLLPLFAFLLMLPVGKKSHVHSLSTPLGLVRMGLGRGTLGAHTTCTLWDYRPLFQACPQLSVFQTLGIVWDKEREGACGPISLCQPAGGH